MAANNQANTGFGFGAFAKADDLKKRLLFTLGALIVYRLGTFIPIPGIDPVALEDIFSQQSSGIIGMFDMFSGGALSRMTIFALNIMPYITASIIMQLMTAIVPSLEQLKKDGDAGRKQINQYTRYLTVLLATVQGYGIAVGLESAQGVVQDPGMMFRITTVVTLVGGTLFLMWLGEQITSRGIGNGISRLSLPVLLHSFPCFGRHIGTWSYRRSISHFHCRLIHHGGSRNSVHRIYRTLVTQSHGSISKATAWK